MIDIVNWPVATTILGGLAIFAFRPALSRLVDRLQSASKDGIKFDRPQSSSPPQIPLTFIELMNLPLSPSAALREQEITDQLHQWQIQEPSQQAAALARALARTYVNFEFSVIANTVFGSQVLILEHLTSEPQGLAIADANDVYALAQSQSPELHAERTAEEWINYMIVRRLITAAEDSIAITQYGRDFLKFLIDESLTFPRYG